jgi:hypothetical protein
MDRSKEEEKFIFFMAGESQFALVNENNRPLIEMVHPLAYSLDRKQHPDMCAVPVAYKYSRDFYELYKSLRTLPK